MRRALDAERVAKNDAAFRSANEQIERAAATYDVEPAPFLCECAEEQCTEIVHLTLEEYEDVRSNPRQFFNVPGHQVSGGEHVRVVANRGRYLVIEKVGKAGEIVEDLDARLNVDA
jgi:hypothetical protein